MQLYFSLNFIEFCDIIEDKHIKNWRCDMGIIKGLEGGYTMNIGKIISDRRKALGFTQQALAEKLNISFQAILKW